RSRRWSRAHPSTGQERSARVREPGNPRSGRGTEYLSGRLPLGPRDLCGCRPPQGLPRPLAGHRRERPRRTDGGADGHLHPTRDGPSRGHFIHRPSLASQAQHGAEEARETEEGRLGFPTFRQPLKRSPGLSAFRGPPRFVRSRLERLAAIVGTFAAHPCTPPAMVVIVLGAFLLTDFTSPDAGFQQRADDIDVTAGAARRDAVGGFTNVRAVEAGANALAHIHLFAQTSIGA